MSFRDELHKVAQANKDHQYALKVYTERLETELESVEKLLSIAEQSDDEPDVDAGGAIIVPDAVKAIGPVPVDVLSGMPGFMNDIEKRHRYLRATDVHPMRATELDLLTEAVNAENYRLHALELQQRGQHVFGPPPSHYENIEGIDWERVAMKVSTAASSSIQRTAKECKIKWLGSRRPHHNHSPWTPGEISRVKELDESYRENEIDWVEVAQKLGTNRIPVDCLRYAIPRKTHVWSPESDRRLTEAIRIYGIVNWQQVAKLVSEDVTATQCQSRYMRSLDPSISRVPWTEEEDARLRDAVEIYGTAWSEIAEFLPNRNSEQCRERWQEKLSPTLAKGKWAEAEDQALLAAVEQVGEGKWKEISRILGNGRTDNMCRSRYHVLSKRRLREEAAAASVLPSGTTIRGVLFAQTKSPPTTSQTAVAVVSSGSSGAMDTPEAGLSGSEFIIKPPPAAKSRPKPRRKQVTKATETIIPEDPHLQPDQPGPSHSPTPPTESPNVPAITVHEKGGRNKKPTTRSLPNKKRKAGEQEIQSTNVPDTIDCPPAPATAEAPSTKTAETTEQPGDLPQSADGSVPSVRGRGRGRGRGKGRGLKSHIESTPARKSARLASKSNIDDV
ncbi:hypothetical protein QCA50_000258 [Cerrena zonata]|uniref:Uncharacterized protein n=1 Tax=Cerrena zonata TaxID=2478898 RepID=A0AAW0GYQ0_9APHY